MYLRNITAKYVCIYIYGIYIYIYKSYINLCFTSSNKFTNVKTNKKGLLARVPSNPPRVNQIQNSQNNVSLSPPPRSLFYVGP